MSVLSRHLRTLDVRAPQWMVFDTPEWWRLVSYLCIFILGLLIGDGALAGS